MFNYYTKGILVIEIFFSIIFSLIFVKLDINILKPTGTIFNEEVSEFFMNFYIFFSIIYGFKIFYLLLFNQKKKLKLLIDMIIFMVVFFMILDLNYYNILYFGIIITILYYFLNEFNN